MRLTDKLLDSLNRVFDKDPTPFLALRVRYAGGMVWSVSEGILTLTVSGGIGSSAAYNLANYSLRTLAAAIAGSAGYEVQFLDATRADLSALVLLDGEGDQDQSNGDRLLGYTSLLWGLLETYAVELQALKDSMASAPDQLSTATGSGYWLDEIGSYYGVPRNVGEVDDQYGRRIIAQVLRPISNNVAIERAVEDFTGQPCSVVDVTIYRGVFPVYDGTILHDGSYNYDTVGLPNYGLFDVSVAYDLIVGGDIREFLTTVEMIVERLRAAGTHLRSLALVSAATPMSDSFAPPADSSSGYAGSMSLSETSGGSTESFSTLLSLIAPSTETFTAPSDDLGGSIYRMLVTSDGAIITDSLGDPILVGTGDLLTGDAPGGWSLDFSDPNNSGNLPLL